MKHKKKQKHLEGPCNTQEDTPQRQSPVEAAACRQAAGERPDFSKGFIGVFSPLKRPRLEKDGPCNTKDDAPQPKSTEEIPSCGQGAREKSAFSEPFVCVFSPSKHPRLHEDGRCVSQDNVPQPESPVEAAACSQAAGEKPACSGHPTAVSTPSKRARPDEDGEEYTAFHQPRGKVSCPGASERPAFQSVRKPKSTQQHLQAKLNSGEGAFQRRHKAVALTQHQKAGKAASSESISSKDKGDDAGRCVSQDNVPQPEPPVEAAACSQAAGEKPACSGHPISVSTPSKRARPDEDGRCVSQDNVPQPESPVEAAACSQAAGEKPACSGHPTAVSTPSKRARPDEDGEEYTEMKELPVSQHSEPTEDSSDYLQTYIPSHALNKNEPFQSPVHGTDVRPMKMYYMRVQLERGVAVLFHTKEGLVPPSKKIKMEEMTYLGKVHKDVPFSHMSEKEHLIACQPMLDSRAQEKRGEADRPAQPPALSGYPRAKTPEWLVALDSGFRCMACCRVFPSLEVLQEHVECGVREGFSCHVFHRAMAHLKYKERMRKKKERKKKATFRF